MSVKIVLLSVNLSVYAFAWCAKSSSQLCVYTVHQQCEMSSNSWSKVKHGLVTVFFSSNWPFF